MMWNETSGDKFSQALERMTKMQSCKGISGNLPNVSILARTRNVLHEAFNFDVMWNVKETVRVNQKVKKKEKWTTKRKKDRNRKR